MAAADALAGAAALAAALQGGRHGIEAAHQLLVAGEEGAQLSGQRIGEGFDLLFQRGFYSLVVAGLHGVKKPLMRLFALAHNEQVLGSAGAVSRSVPALLPRDWPHPLAPSPGERGD